MSGNGGAPAGAAERLFRGLGRAIARHPWYPIVFWILLLVIALPFFGRIGSVTSNSATQLPASAPSSIAAAKIQSEFPNQSAGSDSLLLFTGPDLLGPAGTTSIRAVAAALRADPNLTYVGGVETVYDAYAQFLAGQAELGGAALDSALPGALEAANGTAQLLWGPVALYVGNWQAYGAAHPGSAPSTWNAPVRTATEAQLPPNGTARAILEDFYAGPGGDGRGFNGTGDCAADPATVAACSDAVARSSLANVSAPGPTGLVPVVLGWLGVENFSSAGALRNATAQFVASSSGLSGPVLRGVWNEFPALGVTAALAGQYADGVVNTSLPSAYPIPIPGSIAAQFLSSDGQAEVVFVSYTVGSGFTTPQGGTPVYSDVGEIDRAVPRVLSVTDPGGTIAFVQTGEGPLDAEESSVLSSSLAVVLPLTVGVLIAITILYFRAPIVPAVSFGALGIALGLGIGAIVLVGTVLGHVDETAIELEETFVLGVGTDYSIFLISRFREELERGAGTAQAVETAVTWAGQSVATSGATAVIATLALAFSGVGLLSQWGTVLSLAILLTILISLTVVPAALVLLGPRVFWPYTGARFARRAARGRARTDAGSTYFQRVGRFTQRRPYAVLAVVAVVSVPLVLVALQVPVSYDFYNQLPGDRPASSGLTALDAHFGGGYAFPVQALIVFPSPLLAGHAANTTELLALGTLADAFAGTPGVASVRSPVGGTGGAPLGSWANFSTLPPAVQSELTGSLAGSMGADGRSVLVEVISSAPGLSNSAVGLLGTLEQATSAVRATHPSLGDVYFGGGAPTTRDLEQQTALATDRMILAVAIGLFVVLLAVLRSWMIPLLAIGSIGLSLAWAWALTDLVLHQWGGVPLFFFVPTLLFIIILGLGIDYNIFLLTRVREERLRVGEAREAVVRAVGATGGIITAAAVILASAFAVLSLGQFLILRSIGFAVAVAVLLDAMVVRTYVVPSALQLLGDRVWRLNPMRRRPPPAPTAAAPGSDPSDRTG